MVRRPAPGLVPRPGGCEGMAMVGRPRVDRIRLRPFGARGARSPGPQPYLPGPSVHGRFEAELQAGPWAKRALVAYLAVIVVELLVAWAERSLLREIIHNIRVQQQTGVVQNQALPVVPADLNLLSLLNLVFVVPFYVFLLRWQFQAAATARFLFLPANARPGSAWAVGSSRWSTSGSPTSPCGTAFPRATRAEPWSPACGPFSSPCWSWIWSPLSPR